MKKYNSKNRVRLTDYFRQRRQRQKMSILKHYSKTKEPSCECCGESHLEFLTVDHIAGNGSLHRKSLGGSRSGSAGIYMYIIKKGFPSGYKILCFNCNCALGFLGYCPHGNVKIEKDESINEWPLFPSLRINESVQ